MNESEIRQLVAELRTYNREDACCTLRCMGPGIVPVLCDEFARASIADVRQDIVQIINHYRRPEDLAFFARALRDRDEKVWQAAIDAFVSQPGLESLKLLGQAVEYERGLVRSQKLAFLEDAVAELRKPHPYSVGDSDC